MRVYDQGALVRVTCSADDVAAFKRTWPASGMHYGDRCSFTFDKRNGDLVDMSYNGRFPEPARVDGSAIAALSQDAQKFAGV